MNKEAMQEKIRILLLEDNITDSELLLRELRKNGLLFKSERVDTEEGFRKAIDDFHPDIILADYTLPQFDGLSALAIARECCPNVPFVFVTGTMGEEIAVNALKMGATDYVLKDQLSRLAPAVTRALQVSEEISERRRLRQALRESERLYRLLAENTYDMITRHLPDSTYLYASPACRALFGYEPEELLGTKAFAQMHPEDVKRVISISQEAVKTGGANVAQYRHLTKDGRYIWVETAGKVIKNAATDEVEDIICVVRDITDRKQAEDELKKSRQQIRMLLDSAAEGIYGINLEGKCTFVNAACLRILGYDDEIQVLGENMHHLIHAKYHDGSAYPEEKCRIFEAFRKGEKVHADDEVLWRADGTSFPVEYWSYPVEEESSVIGAVVTFIDITERRLAEELENQRTEQKLLNKEALLFLMQMHLENREELLKHITLVAAQILGVERTGVWFISMQHTEIMCEVLYILSTHMHETGTRLYAKHFPQYFAALEEDRVVAAENALSDLRTSEMAEDYLKPHGIVSKMDIPIRRHGNIVGIMCFEHPETRQWTNDEKEFAGSLSHILTENLEKFDRKKAETDLRKHEEELQKRVKELEEFYQLAVGRELRMKDLKERIEELEAELAKYKRS